jgi:hypothetical protein
MNFIFKDGNFTFRFNFYTTHPNLVDILTDFRNEEFPTISNHISMRLHNIVDRKIIWKDNAISYLRLTPAAVNYIEKIVKNLVFI